MAVNMNGLGVGGTKTSQTTAPRAEQTADKSAQINAPAQDSVTLSNQAQGLMGIKDRIDATPDIDQPKVDAVRAALTQGTFEIDSQSIAERMLGIGQE